CREVAGHRGDQQKARVLGAPLFRQIANEMEEAAKRALPDYLLGNGDWLAVDRCLFDAEFRLAVAARRSLEDFASRSGVAAKARMRQRIERVVDEQAPCISHNPSRPHGS